MMKDAIQGFPKQLSFEPTIIRSEKLKRYERAIVLGMGGSHLAADLIQAEYPELALSVHSDYGLPPLSELETTNTLIIASSYSGNTEETIDGLRQAIAQNLSCAVITVGGVLETMANQNDLPMIKLPDTGIQPRSALGFSLKALASLLGLEEMNQALTSLVNAFDQDALEQQGRTLAEQLIDRVPIIYASTTNRALAYNWKIKCNETGKIPAFMNVIPELHHNEMTGFDATPSSKNLNDPFAFIVLTDTQDHPRNQTRMTILSEMLSKKNLPVLSVPVAGTNRWQAILSSLLVADWMALALAEHYGHEAEQVPMVEDFKKQMANATV